MTGYRCLLPVLFLSLTVITRGADDRLPEIKILQPGVELTIVAEHPDIATPTGLDVDADGRIWAVACHTHMREADYEGPEKDEILIFDPDGKRHVFYAATEQTMDLELGVDGWVYLSERDRILRVRDNDGDGKGDVEETIVELISEERYPHNALSGLAWAPNGDLVFGMGENFAKAWKLQARGGNAFTGLDRGGVFRLDVAGRELSKVAEGLWNPFGVTVRADGEIFAAENDPGENPPCKLLHIVEGGDYGYRRKYGGASPHPFVWWNGEMRGTLPMIHPSGEAPCGVLPLGRGLLVPSWGDHRIDFFPLTPQGASFTAGQVTLAKGSRYFRPTCIARDVHHKDAHSAVFYLTDWVDGRYSVHGFGRLWKLEIDLEEAGWLGPLDLEPRNEEATLAPRLRKGESGFSRSKLFELSRDEDPFIASGALNSLSGLAGNWSPKELRSWPDPDRIEAVQALRLARVDPEGWIDGLLDDSNAGVQFETLRWIADEDLEAYLPAVESLLAESDLKYEVFEGAIAAHTALSGKPELGLRNPELLLARVKDESSSAKLRAFALRLLPVPATRLVEGNMAQKAYYPPGLTVELLEQLLEAGDATLSLEVVRVLAGNPKATRTLLSAIAGDETMDFRIRSEAILGLAAVAEEHTGLLLNLASHDDAAVREEALRALRGVKLTEDQRRTLDNTARKFPRSSAPVAALTDPASLLKDRPALTDTALWQKRLAGVEGPADPVAGERIFHHPKVALCANCHRSGGRGNVVGPDLSHVAGRKDNGWLLGAILDPNRDIAPQYMPRVITLNDGSSHVGIRLRSYVNEQIRDALGRNHTFKRDDVKTIEDLTMSFMPAGLPMAMTDRELRDLIAFLELSK
ncbi:MAG: c-type cytochrome [Verrucomicrobiales bacterium]|nr:c-type cytochrome [Verrucomicrobiales bacterium]